MGEIGCPPDRGHHLAQVNIARLRAPLGDPAVRGFVDGFDRVARLADRSPGFVWRLVDPSGHHATIDARTLVNLSVWETYEELHHFVYRTAHGAYARRRKRRFEPIGGPTSALWWIPVDDRPALDLALARLEHLRRWGSSPRAFSLLHQFDPTGRPVPPRRSGQAVDTRTR